jgi:hypothetical protein
MKNKTRYQICLECEHLNKTLKLCKICKCFVVLKTQIKNQSCPLKKW